LSVAEISQLNKQPSDVQIKSQYRACFTTPAGKFVLEDLKANFYDARISKEHLERQVGQRDVLLGILEMLRDG
jgi:hypothetical protein